MLQELAKGHIKKNRQLKTNRSITQKVAQYEGELSMGNKKIYIQVYGTNKDLVDKEIFVKISKEISDKEIYGMLT